MAGGGKFIAIGVSIILVVGVAIGVIVGVNKHNAASDDDSKALNGASKAVASICSATDYKKVCVDSLSSVANNQSATPEDYIRAAVETTIKAVKDALEKVPSTVGSGDIEPRYKMSVEDCQDLLQYAIDELQASYSTVGDPKLHTQADRQAELMNWLSAVVSYHETCKDGFEGKPELQSAVSNGLLNATQLTSNALSIVAAMSEILKSFNIPINNTMATSRRLFEAEEDSQFPEWMSAADRKLLASQNNGGLTPNAVVAQDGSGQYKTIAAALAAYPKGHQGRYVIYIKAGIYHEYITVEKDQTNVFMYGDGPRKTIVTGDRSNRGGYQTFRTATFCEL